MSETLTKIRENLTCEGLPLAVYREIVAHLRQIEGVGAGLSPQTASNFDYLQSQVGGLWLEYPADLPEKDKVRAILDYYGQKHGSWSKIS